MKFLLDHDVPDDLSYLLNHLGHDVTLLGKARPGDSCGEAVLQFNPKNQTRNLGGSLARHGGDG